MCRVLNAGLIVALACSLGRSAPPPPVVSADPGRGPFHPVDLSKFYSSFLADLPVGNTWEALPSGLQRFGDVPFRVEGRMEVTGMMAARDGDFAPTRIEGIPVGRKARRLFLLLGATGSEDDGVPLAKLVLHYANGKTQDLRLAYGVHLRTSLWQRYERTAALADPDSIVAWTLSRDSARSDFQLRLFRTALKNPQPDDPIESLDVVSLFSRATPVLLGITLEEGGPLPSRDDTTRRSERRAHDWSDAVYRRQFLIRATDAADGKVLTNATAYLTLTDDKSSFYFGAGQADASGKIALDYPPQQTVGVSLLVKAPNRVPVTIPHSRTNAPTGLSDEFDVKLQAGALIGGVVKTPKGEPIADAEIVVSKVVRESSRRYLQTDYDTVKTDSTGKWSSRAVPADFEDFQFEVTHPLFRSVRFLQAGGTNAPPRNLGLPSRAGVDTGLSLGGDFLTLPPSTQPLPLIQVVPKTNSPPARYPALINVDFGDGTNSAKAGFAATGVAPTDFWNLYTRDDRAGKWRSSGNVTNLLYADRSPSGVNVTVQNAPGAWGNGSSDPMYSSYLYPLDGGPITVTLGNLPLGLYDLYVYGHEASTNRVCAYDLSVGKGDLVAHWGSRTNGVGSAWNSTNWQDGIQFVVFRSVQVLAPDDVMTLVARPPSRSTLAVIAGLQLRFLTNQPGPPKVQPQSPTLVTAEATSRQVFTSDGLVTEVLPDGVTRRTIFRPARPAAAPPPLSKPDLLAGKAAMVLEPAIRVMGTVADPSGKPIPNADVVFFDAPENREPRGTYKGDASGKFAFTVAQPTMGALAVLAKGYAPNYSVVSLPSEVNSVPVTLRSGTRVTGQIRGVDGTSVSNATVRVESWHNNQLLRWQARTDADGRFTWDNAPEDQVRLYITASNYYNMTYSTSLGSTREFSLTLNRPFMAVGQVVDAETRKPVEEFTVLQGYRYSYSGESIRWLRYNTARGRAGEFSLRLNDYGSATNWLRVEAKGYLPVLSSPFARGGQIPSSFELKRGKGLAGTVELPTGEAVPNCIVVLTEPGERPQMDRVGQLRYGGSSGDYARTDARGRFEFAPKLDARMLFAAHDRGYAEVTPVALQKSGKIVLQPWGLIRGTVRVGQGPWANRTVVLQNESIQYDADEGPSPHLYLWLRSETDAAGQFAFDRVPAGWRQVSLQYTRTRDSEGDDSSTLLSHGTPLLVKPGETAEVTLGGTGRALVGRIRTQGAAPTELDWFRDSHMLNSRLSSPTFVGPDVSKAKTDAERQQMWRDFERKQRQFWFSDEGRALSRQQRRYALLFETNGTFRIESVAPGTYDLFINLSERENLDENSWTTRQIGSLNKEIVVPSPPAGRSNEPLDLGALDMVIRRPLRIGQSAPALEAKTLDGKTVRLADFRGTNVLLHFHASWAGNYPTDLTALRSLHQTYGGTNGSLLILGLSVEHNAKAAEDFVRNNQIQWLQCYLGPWSETSVPAQFGVEGVPCAVLIDARGFVRAKNLRGTTIRTTVRNALTGRSGLVPLIDE